MPPRVKRLCGSSRARFSHQGSPRLKRGQGFSPASKPVYPGYAMKVWLIALIAFLAGLLGYEGLKFLHMFWNREALRETARSTLADEVSRNSLRGARLPRSPRIWPETETRLKEVLIKRGMELQIPVGEKDIALWYDESKVYCRVAWTWEIRIFAFSLGPVLSDWTVEVPRP